MTSELYTQYQSFSCALCVYMYRCASICFIYTYVCIHTHTHLPACVHVNIILLAFKGHTLLLVWSCNLLLLSLACFCFSSQLLPSPSSRCKRGGFVWQQKATGKNDQQFWRKAGKGGLLSSALHFPNFLPSFLPSITSLLRLITSSQKCLTKATQGFSKKPI